MKGMLQIELPMKHQSLKDCRKIKLRINKKSIILYKTKKAPNGAFFIRLL